MNDLKVKISELESSNNISPNILNEAVVPIAIKLSDSEIGNTYKLKLSDRYYDKNYINNQFSWIQEYVNKKISGIDVPDEYDDTSITASLGVLNEHIQRLKNGALVDIVAYEDVDKSGYSDINSFNNILYKPLTADKILISNTNGRIEASNINADKLEILKDWNFTKKINENGVETEVPVTLAEKIKEMEDKIEELSTSIRNTSNYSGPTYTSSEEISTNNMEHTAKNDGLLVVIPYYKYKTKTIISIYINDLWVGEMYTVTGDGHSHDGGTYPVKKGDRVKFVITTGKVRNTKAYFIY
jgi:hypothetical protein